MRNRIFVKYHMFKICEIHPQQEEQIVLTVEPMLAKLHLRHK